MCYRSITHYLLFCGFIYGTRVIVWFYRLKINLHGATFSLKRHVCLIFPGLGASFPPLLVINIKHYFCRMISDLPHLLYRYYRSPEWTNLSPLKAGVRYLITFDLCCNLKNLSPAIILRSRRVEFSDKLDGETVMYRHLDALTEICVVQKKRYLKPKSAFQNEGICKLWFSVLKLYVRLPMEVKQWRL